jgi:hypothetical protein
MADQVFSGAEGEHTALQGTVDSDGQPDNGTGDTDGEPEQTDGAQTDGQPDGGEPQPKEAELAALKESYQNLQSKFNKRDEEISDLREIANRIDKIGGIETIEQSYNFLNTNEDFRTWLKDYQRKEQGGIDLSQYDEDQREAIALVDKISKQNAEFSQKQVIDKVLQIIEDRVGPLTEARREERIEKVFSRMDSEYEGWHEMQPVMKELAAGLPEHIADNPSFRDVEYLYFLALKQEGKFDDYAAKIHQKKLEELKTKQTDGAPSSQVQKKPGRAKTLAEALAMAEKERNFNL